MEFARVLLVGAIFLGLAYFLTVPQTGVFTSNGLGGGSGTSQWKPASREVIGSGITSTDQGDTTLTGASNFFVGVKEGETFKEISLPKDKFIVSYLPKPTLLATTDESRISNGLSEHSKEAIVFGMDPDEKETLKGVVITLDILDTNNLGDMTVAVNGNLVYEGVPSKGETIIDVSSSIIQEENTIDIDTKSSGWRFWAPAIYIFNSEVRADFISGKSRDVTFTASGEEVDKFKLGRLIFSSRGIEGQGAVNVELNGQEIFDDSPENQEVVDFKDIRPVKGVNTLQISAKDDSEYEVNLDRLLLFYDAEISQTIERGILVSQADFNKLPGTLSFDVDKIIGNPTTMRITFENNEGERGTHIISNVIGSNRTVEFEVTKFEISKGVNKVILSATGDGGFEVKNFKVNY